MKFKFSFETLLTQRHQAEEAARRDWSEAQAKVDAAKQELNEFYDQLDAARDRAGSLEKTGGQQAGALVSISEFIYGQNVRIERLRLSMRELVADAEIKRETMVEAAKEKKTLQKLKEKQIEAFKLKMKKRELKEVDELIVTRFRTGQENVG